MDALAGVLLRPAKKIKIKIKKKKSRPLDLSEYRFGTEKSVLPKFLV
jgi:hypothetical protein